jgi:GDPmannose 4,6-dehydratase
MGKTALICGVTGQDGAYLARLLLSKGYQVIGTSRDAEASTLSNLVKLGTKSQVTLTTMSLNDFRSVLQVITKYEPVEIYNLAGQTSVGLSFIQPVETMESISIGAFNLLEAIRSTSKKIRFFSAGFGEVFGETGDRPANEETAFCPNSPYAIAKAAAFWQVANYREAYDLFACTGLLFNHESPLRPQHFVTQKIINGAKEIAAGNLQSMVLGNLDITRDWGWAPEYVEAMWMMLQTPTADDYVIATGTSYSLEQFVEKAFEPYGLDWKKYVQVDKSFFRPLDIHIIKADSSKAQKQLGWQAKVALDQVIGKMASGSLF